MDFLIIFKDRLVKIFQAILGLLWRGFQIGFSPHGGGRPTRRV
jgi:hypothetical protein